MKKEKIVGLGVLTLILAAGASTVFASNGFGRINSEAMKVEREQNRVEMQEIFANGTYSDWVNLSDTNFEAKVTQMRTRHQEMISQVTEENWSEFKEAHQLMLAGDQAGAQVIMEDLGIERGMGIGKPMGGSRMGGNVRGERMNL
jgi:hypothetical protein